MSVKSTLKDIAAIAKYYKIDKPYIVGGLPRDLFLKKEIKTTDVDLTTNSPDVMRLGVLASDHFNEPFELSEDGHITVFLPDFEVDFSSHFVSDAVIQYLNGDHKGFEEAFSRDFTINCLHQDLETSTFFDPTGKSIDDLNNKIIRTPVPTEITFSDDPRRVYRAINFAVRYDFIIDDEIIQFVKNNTKIFSGESIKDKYIITKLNKSIEIDPDKTLDLLFKLDLFRSIPLSGKFKDLLIERKLLKEYLDEPISKTAQVTSTWDEYIKQGPAFEAIKNWWQEHYTMFPEYNSPDYSSWTKWYMNHYRNDWNFVHKSPEKTLQILQEEVSGGSDLAKFVKDTFRDIYKNIPPLSFFNPIKNPEISLAFNSNFLENINLGPNVDVQSTTPELKSFIKALGAVAKQMGAETPYITSGYRSVDKQARLMLYNWKNNGGLKSGRRYLTSLYGNKYGNEIAEIFEKYYGSEESILHAIPVIEKYGGQHIQNPAQAIDLRLTTGITDVLRAIEKSKRFHMKLIDERKSAGHWHVTIYGEKV